MDKILEKWDEILSTVKHEHDISDISLIPDSPARSLRRRGQHFIYTGSIGTDDPKLYFKKYYLPLKVTIAELTGTEYEIKFILPEQTKNIRTGNSGVPKKCTFRKGGQIKSESELYIRHVRRRQQ